MDQQQPHQHEDDHSDWQGEGPAPPPPPPPNLNLPSSAYGPLQNPPGYAHPIHPVHPQQPRYEPASPGRIISLLISWMVILGVVGLIFLGTLFASSLMESKPNEPDPIGLEMMKLQSRALLMQKSMAPATADDLLDQAYETLYGGTIPQRLRFAVLAGELSGPDEAVAALDETDAAVARHDDVEYSDTEVSVGSALRTLYGDYANDAFDAPSLSADQKALLVQELGWFGELALHPAQGPDREGREEVLAPVQRFMTTVFVMLGFGGFVGFAGLIGLIAMLVLALMRKFPNMIGYRLPYGHVYAETFGIWLLVFFGLQVVVEALPIPIEHALFASAVAFFMSLIVLAWPRIRGIPFSQSRRDIGWTTGKSIFIEPFAGIAAYAMTLPILAIGVAIVFVLMLVQGLIAGVEEMADHFGPTGGPAHPIIQSVGSGQAWPILQLYLVAAVAAPIVEETMFRGVLHRHLRSLTGRWAVPASIIISTLINAFLFAIIHPQGIIAVPALMSLAIAMTLAREWRGTLIPSMIIHGVSNGLVMTLLLMLLGG